MSLINAAMALGVLAFTVPLAIHLLYRSRFRTLDWGAMFLLQGVVRANRRRMQWHQWILLLLRCSIPVLLALAMARPLITGSLLSGVSAIPGDAPLSLVLVVDDSRSIAAGGRASRLLGAISQLLDSLSRGDEVLLLRTSRIDQTPVAMSARESIERINQIRFETAAVDWPSVMTRSVEACELASHGHRRIVIASDFQNIQTAGESLPEVKSKCSRMNPAPAVDWLDVSLGDSSLDNLLVERIETQTPAIVVDHAVRLTATIQNDGDLPIVKAMGRWIVDGQTVGTEAINLPAHGGVTVEHELTPARVGGKVVGFAVEHTDALAADNRRDIALHVSSPVRVWLVDGEPSDDPLRGETDFLNIALSPFAFGSSAARGRDVVTTQVVAPSQVLSLFEKKKDERPDVIVLANVQGSIDLSRIIQAGVSVVFFDGLQVDAESWQSVDWLPAKLGDVVPASDAPPRWTGSRWAPWRALDRDGATPLTDVAFDSIRKLIPSEDADVLLTAGNDSPLVVRQSVGTFGAEVIQFAVPCDTAGSNWPLRPSFLPMMQSLVLQLAGDSQNINVLPGQPLRFAFANSAEMLEIIDPTGTVHRLEVGDDGVSAFHESFAPGIYRVKRNSETQDSAESDIASTVGVVTVPPEESVLIINDQSELSRLADRSGASIREDAESLVSAARTDRNGREIWRWLMIGLLAVMVGELMWQRRIAPATSVSTALPHSIPLSRKVVAGQS